MSKLISYKILLLGFLFVVQVHHSQIKIGVKAGYSIGNITDTSDNIYAAEYTSTSGIDYGLLAEFVVVNDFSIQVEMSFTERGGIRNGMQPVPFAPLRDALADNGVNLDILNLIIQGQGGQPISLENPFYADFDNEVVLEYLEVPILAKYGWGSDWRFYITGGPYMGFLLNATQKTSGQSKFYLDPDGNIPLVIPNPIYDPGNPATGPEFIEFPEQSFDATTDTKSDLNTFNLGIQGGAGIIRKLGEKHEIFLDVRGSYSFIPLQIESVYGSSKVGAGVFSFGYALTL